MIPVLHIDVISDVVCPWRYIGKRHLAAAIARWNAEQPQHPVNVRWHPYFLNPDTPEGGELYRPFLERKFGHIRSFCVRCAGCLPSRIASTISGASCTRR
jgi:predicted DsbA family dithiol-disulfide isomerase